MSGQQKPKARVSGISTEQEGSPAVETPTAAMTSAGAQRVECIDAKGRTIAIRRLAVLDRMRLLKALGAELSKNDVYLGHAALAASVVSIDGSIEAFPASEAQLMAMVGRLGDEGFDAVSAAYAKNWGAEILSETDKATIKN